MYLFWIDLDIVFFLEVEKLIYIETLYCLAMEHFVGILTYYSCIVCFLFFPTVNTITSTKCLRLKEKSSILWHKRLGHISKERMERLIKNEIIPDLDFSVFDTCAQ